MARFTIEQMNAAKDAHRHRGTTGGKGNAIKTDYGHMARDPIREIVARAKFEISDAIEQFRFDVCGDEWVHLCPF